jgi:DNA-binding NarL/FixJ family response regulator
MTTLHRVSVSIVEDDRITRETLMALIEKAPDLRFVAAYPDAESAIREIPKNPPDVVVMDLNLSGKRSVKLDGTECVAAVKSTHPGLKVIMLTVYDDTDKIFQSLRAGASGYLLKRSHPNEILRAIREVHEGGPPMSMNIACRVMESLSVSPRPGAVDTLTLREREILSLLAQGVTDKQIAHNLGISSSTVRGHLHTIYGKLYVDSRTQAVLKYLGR